MPINYIGKERYAHVKGKFRGFTCYGSKCMCENPEPKRTDEDAKRIFGKEMVK